MRLNDRDPFQWVFERSIARFGITFLVGYGIAMCIWGIVPTVTLTWDRLHAFGSDLIELGEHILSVGSFAIGIVGCAFFVMIGGAMALYLVSEIYCQSVWLYLRLSNRDDVDVSNKPE